MIAEWDWAILGIRLALALAPALGFLSVDREFTFPNGDNEKKRAGEYGNAVAARMLLATWPFLAVVQLASKAECTLKTSWIVVLLVVCLFIGALLTRIDANCLRTWFISLAVVIVVTGLDVLVLNLLQESFNSWACR